MNDYSCGDTQAIRGCLLVEVAWAIRIIIVANSVVTLEFAAVNIKLMIRVNIVIIYIKILFNN